MPVTISKRLERALIKLVEDESLGKRDRLRAAIQLAHMKEEQAKAVQAQKPARTVSNVLGG